MYSLKFLQPATLSKTIILIVASHSFAMTAQAVAYHINELPPVAGFDKSFARNINDKGVVVGDSHPVVANYFTATATVWRNQIPANLGKAPKGQYSYASAINSAGKIAGDADDGDSRPNVVVFQGGSASFIGSGANNSHAAFVGNSGFIVGNYAKGFGGAGWLPVMWTEDAKKPGRYNQLFLQTYLDPTGVASNNFISDGNNNGLAVGYVNSPTVGQRAGLWKNDAKHTLQVLPQLPNAWGEYAMGINDNGLIVGVSDEGIFSSTPVVWGADANRTVTALPLFPGEAHGSANKINNLNQVIGTHGDQLTIDANGEGWVPPAVWINGRIFDLQQNLDGSAMGWKLLNVVDINNLGQIVGNGILNGKTRGFILTPVAP